MDLRKSFLGTALLLFATTSNAAIISVSDSIFGADSVTRDTVSDLEWLDVTLSINRSYNDVSSQFGSGGDFEGWRYATGIEFATLWDNILGNNPSKSLNQVQLPGDDESLDPYIQMLGDTYEADWINRFGTNQHAYYGKAFGDYNTSSWGIIADNSTATQYFTAWAHDGSESIPGYQDFTWANYSGVTATETFGNIGSWLVRASTPSVSVPEPSIIALFGAGLIGLGIARRKVRT